MEITPCYRDTADLVNEASAVFGSSVRLDTMRLGHLDQICAMVDDYARCVEAKTMDVSVDENTRALVFAIRSDELIVEPGPSAVFFPLIAAVDAFRFSKSGGDMLTELFIEGLWSDRDG